MYRLKNKIRKRICVSCITDKQCEKYKKDSASISLSNKPICENLDLFDITMGGYQDMKKDGFVLTRGLENV